MARPSKTFRIIAILIVTLFGGFPLSANENTKQYGQVETVIKNIIAADNEGDIEKVLSLYANDAVLIPPSGRNISGLEEIRENYVGLFGANSLKITNEIWETRISGTWAYSFGANCVTAISKTNETRETAFSKYLMVLRMEESGQWKIARLIWANQAAAEMEGNDGLHCQAVETGQ